jgi:hypothetical protein
MRSSSSPPRRPSSSSKESDSSKPTPIRRKTSGVSNSRCIGRTSGVSSHVMLLGGRLTWRACAPAS